MVGSDGSDAVVAHDGFDPPRWAPEPPLEGVMSEVSLIGLDLAKYVFQVHGAEAAGGG